MKEDVTTYVVSPNYKLSKDIQIMYKDKKISNVCVEIKVIKVNGFDYDYKTRQLFNDIKKEQLDKITED